MFKIGLDIQGLTELESTLKLLKSTEINRITKIANRRAARITRNAVKKNTPQKTEKLKSNIKDKSSKKNSDAYVYVDVDAFYWHFLEYGTSKMTAHPFIRPTIDSTEGEALDAAYSTLTLLINKALSK